MMTRSQAYYVLGLLAALMGNTTPPSLPFCAILWAVASIILMIHGVMIEFKRRS
jgi:sulfite exporter TauE/SafE